MSIPIAFLPGASGRSAIWRTVADLLAHLEPTVLVDYPGLGGPAEPGIGSLSDLYRKVMSSLPDRCDVVALSMGNVLALRAALEHPERIRRLVLVAASGGIDVRRLGAEDWRDEWRASRSEAPVWFLDDRTDLTGDLGRIAAPALLVFGDRDPISPVAVGDFLLRHLGTATLKVVPGGTHDLVEEHPQLMAQLIESHLCA
jgi:pimeloyl-ACP methyl ester carboxylesterase